MNKLLLLNNPEESDHELLNFASRFAAANGLKLTVNSPSVYPSNPQVAGSYDLHHVRTVIKSRIVKSTRPEVLANEIRRENYAMVIVKPSANTTAVQYLLNHVHCPLMLMPETLSIDQINRIVYLTDLRYAQREIVQQLNHFEYLSLLVAHICESGLPDLYPSYGCELFRDTMIAYGTHEKSLFSHIRETDISKITDILTSTLKADMLVCSHRKYDWKQLLVSVPVLVFPS